MLGIEITDKSGIDRLYQSALSYSCQERAALAQKLLSTLPRQPEEHVITLKSALQQRLKVEKKWFTKCEIYDCKAAHEETHHPWCDDYYFPSSRQLLPACIRHHKLIGKGQNIIHEPRNPTSADSNSLSYFAYQNGLLTEVSHFFIWLSLTLEYAGIEQGPSIKYTEEMCLLRRAFFLAWLGNPQLYCMPSTFVDGAIRLVNEFSKPVHAIDLITNTDVYVEQKTPLDLLVIDNSMCSQRLIDLRSANGSTNA